MLKYSKFVNCNTGRERKSPIAPIENQAVPRHEAISATYVEVVVYEHPPTPVPAILEEMFADALPANLNAIFDEMLEDQQKKCLHKW